MSARHRKRACTVEKSHERVDDRSFLPDEETFRTVLISHSRTRLRLRGRYSRFFEKVGCSVEQTRVRSGENTSKSSRKRACTVEKSHERVDDRSFLPDEETFRTVSISHSRTRLRLRAREPVSSKKLTVRSNKHEYEVVKTRAYG